MFSEYTDVNMLLPTLLFSELVSMLVRVLPQSANQPPLDGGKRPCTPRSRIVRALRVLRHHNGGERFFFMIFILKDFLMTSVV